MAYGIFVVVEIYVFWELFRCQKEFTLFAFLDEDVFAVDEHVGRRGSINVGHLLAVD